MTKEMPSDYVVNQKLNNEFHSDGRKVGFIEESTLVLKYFLRLMSMVEGEKSSFLDIGCRMGYCLPVMEEVFPHARVVGVDIVPEFIEEANQLGDAYVADMHNLPFGEDEFDFTFCAQTLEHAYDPQQAANEIMRVTRCGFLVGIPLEGPTPFEINKSHYAYSDNAITWLRLFEKSDKFRLYHAIASNVNTYMNFIFLRVRELDE